MSLQQLLRILLVSGLVAAVGLAGCIDDSDSDDETPDDEMVVEPIATVTTQGQIPVSVATPARSLSQGDTYPFTVDANTTGFIFELEWTPSPGSSEALSIWVQAEGAGTANEQNLVDRPEPILKVSGTSPLHAAVAFEDFPEPGMYEILLRAAEPAGAVYEQPYTLHRTTFTGVAFDATFSALNGTADAMS